MIEKISGHRRQASARALVLAALTQVAACASTATGRSGVEEDAAVDSGVDGGRDASYPDGGAPDTGRHDAGTDVQGDAGQPDTGMTATPVVELFSAVAGSQGNVGIFGRVRLGDSYIAGHTLRLQVEGGDGSVDNFANGSYSRSDADNNTITMDHVCVTTGPTTTVGNVLLPDSSRFGQVYLTPAGCRTGDHDSGWSIARLYTPVNRADTDSTVDLRAVDLNLEDRPSGVVRVGVPHTMLLPGEMSPEEGMTAMPIAGTVRAGQPFSTIITAQSSGGYTIACNSLRPDLVEHTNGEGEAGSGCSMAINGPASDQFRSNVAKNSETSLDSYALSIDYGSTENGLFWSRGQGVMNPRQFWTLYNLGGGMHLFTMVSGARGRTAARVNLARETTNVATSLVQVNVE
ncbi:hypothetical protein KBB08_00975 [Candidatus Gracilibacteria bacterium]|nr:hypothetical protein [Candidatus Gracilibacteria bacterium]